MAARGPRSHRQIVLAIFLSPKMMRVKRGNWKIAPSLSEIIMAKTRRRREKPVQSSTIHLLMGKRILKTRTHTVSHFSSPFKFRAGLNFKIHRIFYGSRGEIRVPNRETVSHVEFEFQTGQPSIIHLSFSFFFSDCRFFFSFSLSREYIKNGRSFIAFVSSVKNNGDSLWNRTQREIDTSRHSVALRKVTLRFEHTVLFPELKLGPNWEGYYGEAKNWRRHTSSPASIFSLFLGHYIQQLTTFSILSIYTFVIIFHFFFFFFFFSDNFSLANFKREILTCILTKHRFFIDYSVNCEMGKG